MSRIQSTDFWLGLIFLVLEMMFFKQMYPSLGLMEISTVGLLTYVILWIVINWVGSEP
jgi:hypothetical protein